MYICMHAVYVYMHVCTDACMHGRTDGWMRVRVYVQACRGKAGIRDAQRAWGRSTLAGISTELPTPVDLIRSAEADHVSIT